MVDRQSQLLLIALVLALAFTWVASRPGSVGDGGRPLGPGKDGDVTAALPQDLPSPVVGSSVASDSPSPSEREPVLESPAVALEAEREPYPIGQPITPLLDPVELGDCKLQLEIYDAATGDEVGAMVNLWRIGAPQNKHWTVGAQLQQPLQVPSEGLVVENLPKGVYRAYFPGARDGAPPLPEFEVRGEWTTQRLPVDLPGKREIFLQLYDEHGQRLDQVRMRVGSRARVLKRPEPSWQTKRLLRSGRDFLDTVGYGGGYSGSAHRSFRQLQDTPDGFRLGEFGEDTRTTNYTQSLSLKQSEHVQAKVSFAIGERAGSTLIFAAPFVPTERLLSSVSYPDGRPVSPADGKVYIEAAAVPISGSSVPDAWRAATIKLWVTVPGYESEVYQATLAEYLAADYRLVPAKNGEK